MSVRVGDRGESKLGVLNKAALLKKYSMLLIKNDKRYPKSTRWLYAHPIAKEVREICACIRYANSVWLDANTPEEDYRFRRSKQVEAEAHIFEMYELIEDSYSAHYIKPNQLKFWTKLNYETETALKAWIKSDKERRKK